MAEEGRAGFRRCNIYYPPSTTLYHTLANLNTRVVEMWWETRLSPYNTNLWQASLRLSAEGLYVFMQHTSNVLWCDNSYISRKINTG